MSIEAKVGWFSQKRPEIEITHCDGKLRHITESLTQFLETGELDPSFSLADQRIPKRLGFSRSLRLKHRDFPDSVISINGVGIVTMADGVTVQVAPPDFTRTISDINPRFGTIIPQPDGRPVVRKNITPLGVCSYHTLESEQRFINMFGLEKDLPFITPRLLATGLWKGSSSGWMITVRPEGDPPIRVAQNSAKWPVFRRDIDQLMEALAYLHRKSGVVHLQLHAGNWEKTEQQKILIHDFETMVELSLLTASARGSARRQDLYVAVEASAELMNSKYVEPAVVDRARTKLVIDAVSAYKKACGQLTVSSSGFRCYDRQNWRSVLSENLDSIKFD